MGCAFEPAITSRPMAWAPKSWGRRGWMPSTCAIYLATLPEVLEVTHAFAQWETGTLTEWLEGEAPTRALLDGCAALKAGRNERERDAFEEAKK